MDEPPSFWLLQAADASSAGEIPYLFAAQIVIGLLLVLLSAALKGGIRALESDPAMLPWNEGRRLRLAARIGQYAALTFGIVALAGPAGRPAASAVTATLLTAGYLGLLVIARRLATRHPAAVLMRMQAPLRAWARLLAPVITRLQSMEEGAAGQEADGELLERMEGLLRAGGLSGDELMLFRNAVEFRERSAADLMVPRTDVVWLTADASLEEALAKVREYGHSRLPVCDGGPDGVIGYLHVRDLHGAVGRGVPADLRGLARPVAFVPETADALSLLRRFRQQRSHLAVVVDEFGGTSGIVTLEDLLEELVGEIRDEFDDEQAEMLPLANGELILDGGVRLEELERRFGLEFGEVEEETVGGFVFGRLAREVSAGDEVEVLGARIRVEGVEGLRVVRVRVIPLGSPAEAAAGNGVRL